MGKLRDWWPSEDLLERKKSSAAAGASGSNSSTSQIYAGSAQINANHACPASTSSPSSSSSSAAAAALRLSEVAAALNAMPIQAASVATSNELNSTASPQQVTLSRPVIKLTNTQDHKEELLRKLLSRSASSSDLQCNKAPTALHLHQQDSSVHWPVAKRAKSSEQASKSPASEDSSDHRKRKRDTSLSLRSTAMLSPAEQPEAEPPIQKEALSRREIHIFSERQRRKGMTHLYAILQSLLPDAKPKTDRCTVLTEAMDYIQELQLRVDDLGRQRTEILTSMGENPNLDASGGTLNGGDGAASQSGRTLAELREEVREQILSAADVVVRFCGRDAFITLNSPKRKGVWSGILQVLHEQDMELLNVTLSTSNDIDYHCIHAKIPATSELRAHELQKMLEEVVISHAILE